ncbi:hypothetical protein FRB98_006998 [Tulasnella sp. 332]|nr:hypothetical protein FRB98_006998 [Tulasnella sp. 332]
MVAELLRSFVTHVTQSAQPLTALWSPEASPVFAPLELNEETSSDPTSCEVERSTIATLIFQGCGTDRFNKFTQNEEPAELEAALRFFERALRLLPPGQQLHHSSVINYASALMLRFEQTTDDSDLDLAIKQLEEWLKAQSPNDPTSRRLVLMTLAQAQDVKWKTFGDFTDLESMIESERQILELCPPNDAEDERRSDRLVAAMAQRPKKVSSDTTVLPKILINDEKVELVEERRLPEGGQTVKKSEMVEKSVMINPKEISTPQAAPPTVTSNNSAPVCVLRPIEKPSSGAWKGEGRQLSTDSNPTPAGSSSRTPPPAYTSEPVEQPSSSAWKGKGRQLSTDGDEAPTASSSRTPFVAPSSHSQEDSDAASIALGRSLIESDLKEQVSTKAMPLMAMGFSQEQVIPAILAAGLNDELALEYLMEGIPEEFKGDNGVALAW